MDLFLKKYRKLRDQIDVKVKELEQKHQKEMMCKAGCSACCREYAILPIEFESVKISLKGKGQTTYNANFGKEECPFLIDSRCSIYEDRPIICRTHGLPLLFMANEDWELSACDLNFTKVPDDYFSFENTFPQDTFNSKLFVLNQEFLNSNKTDKSSSETKLISIQKLIKEL